ncbi:hypothetical protein [Okeania sp. KiyG1]|uniref:hypothetical protein n=1 Tax=Okeania sp. KiyG1 TaxID=2720165 RepID=UPI001923EE7F|nr:hypothetical protein [Okeania sp. KiyG1]GGA14561.1 hypothetical protein CYANOKiyG1_28190 [Okeania sp. KiyG1]
MDKDAKIKQLLIDIKNQKGDQRNQTINSLLNITPKLPGIRQDKHPDYLHAVNNTLFSVKHNIDKFFQSYKQKWRIDISQNSPLLVRQRYVMWINGYLKYDIFDLYRKKNQEISLNTPVGEEQKEDWINLLANEGFNVPTSDVFETYITHIQNHKTQRKGLILELYIENDPEGKLHKIHPKGYPECNAQTIIQYFYLSNCGEKVTVKENWIIVNKQPGKHIRKNTAITTLAQPEKKKTWANLAKEYNIKYQTLKGYWRRHCESVFEEINQDIERNFDKYTKLFAPQIQEILGENDND